MNKEQIIEKIVIRLEKRIASLEKSINEARRAAISSPGGMQSWPDTSKFQLNKLASNLASRCSDLKKCIEQLKKINVSDAYNKARIGTIIKIKTSREAAFYFITPPDAGGEILNLDNNQITTLSIDSPLAQKLSDKKTGDIIKFGSFENSQEILILEIV